MNHLPKYTRLMPKKLAKYLTEDVKVKVDTTEYSYPEYRLHPELKGAIKFYDVRISADGVAWHLLSKFPPTEEGRESAEDLAYTLRDAIKYLADTRIRDTNS